MNPVLKKKYKIVIKVTVDLLLNLQDIAQQAVESETGRVTHLTLAPHTHTVRHRPAVLNQRPMGNLGGLLSHN